MNKRIILVGKGASGKDFARGKLESYGLKYGCSHTSRPKRLGEIEGRDYFFIDLEEAKKLIEDDYFYEWVEFNGWIYGTSNDQFERSDLFIMTPSGISKLKKKDRLESIIIYFDISAEIRFSRLSQRKDADSVERRMLADDKDFENFQDFDYKIEDPNFIFSLDWLENLKVTKNG